MNQNQVETRYLSKAKSSPVCYVGNGQNMTEEVAVQYQQAANRKNRKTSDSLCTAGLRLPYLRRIVLHMYVPPCMAVVSAVGVRGLARVMSGRGS